MQSRASCRREFQLRHRSNLASPDEATALVLELVHDVGIDLLARPDHEVTQLANTFDELPDRLEGGGSAGYRIAVVLQRRL
jgi:hypothetical protein